MHGPASYSGGSYKTPTWPYLPTITILDTIAPTLGLRKKRQWRKLRHAALDRWVQAGLTFRVLVDSPMKYPALDPYGGDEGLLVAMVSPYLRLMSMRDRYGGTIPAVATWLPQTDPAAFAAFYMPDFWAANSFIRANLLTHEIGHCLGLNHRLESPPLKTVMNDTEYNSVDPDVHDLDSLRGYYEL